MKTIQIEVQLFNGSQKELENAVVAETAQLLSENMHGVTSAVQKALKEQVDNEINAQVQNLVATAIFSPHQKTDQWGKPQGEPKTIAVLIREHLLNTGTTYGNDRDRTKAISIAEKVIKDIVQAEMKDEVAQIKASIKETLNVNLKQSMVSALCDAFGLRLR